MDEIYSREKFYVILRKDEILLANKANGVSSYPVWMGKNRSVMRVALKAFRKDPPETLVDFLSFVGHFGLCGGSSSEQFDESLLKK